MCNEFERFLFRIVTDRVLENPGCSVLNCYSLDKHCGKFIITQISTINLSSIPEGMVLNCNMPLIAKKLPGMAFEWVYTLIKVERIYEYVYAKLIRSTSV